jgi:hypothetical protein
MLLFIFHFKDKNMTTIIAQKKQLVADRRQVVNGVKAGIIGVRDEAKIYKLPYCFYGTSGFVVDGKIGGYAKSLFDANIAALCALSFLCEKEKQKDAMIMEQTGWSRKDYSAFQNRVSAMRDMIGREFARDLNTHSQKLLIMTHQITMLVTNDFVTAHTDETVVLGSGEEMVHVLLDHGLPYEEVYPALRASGVPTGATFDVLSLEKDLPSLFPPLSHPNLIAIIKVMMNDRINRQVKNGAMKEDTAARVRYVLVEDLVTLVLLGDVKRNKWYFRKDPICNWKDIDLVMKHKKLFQRMCGLVKVEFEDYLKAKNGVQK